MISTILQICFSFLRQWLRNEYFFVKDELKAVFNEMDSAKTGGINVKDFAKLMKRYIDNYIRFKIILYTVNVHPFIHFIHSATKLTFSPRLSYIHLIWRFLQAQS